MRKFVTLEDDVLKKLFFQKYGIDFLLKIAYYNYRNRKISFRGVFQKCLANKKLKTLRGFSRCHLANKKSKKLLRKRKHLLPFLCTKEIYGKLLLHTRKIL